MRNMPITHYAILHLFILQVQTSTEMSCFFLFFYNSYSFHISADMGIYLQK